MAYAGGGFLAAVHQTETQGAAKNKFKYHVSADIGIYKATDFQALIWKSQVLAAGCQHSQAKCKSSSPCQCQHCDSVLRQSVLIQIYVTVSRPTHQCTRSCLYISLLFQSLQHEHGFDDSLGFWILLVSSKHIQLDFVLWALTRRLDWHLRGCINICAIQWLNDIQCMFLVNIIWCIFVFLVSWVRFSVSSHWISASQATKSHLCLLKWSTSHLTCLRSALLPNTVINAMSWNYGTLLLNYIYGETMTAKYDSCLCNLDLPAFFAYCLKQCTAKSFRIHAIR